MSKVITKEEADPLFGELVASSLSDETKTHVVYLNDLSLCVSDSGDIYRVCSTVKKFHADKANNYGYQKITISRDGKSFSTTVQRIVAYAFKLIPAISYSKCSMDIDHINNNNTDNRLCNLQVLSHSDNIKKRDLGRQFNCVTAFKNGEVYKTYKSQKECADDMHLYTSNLSNLITTKKHTHIDGNDFYFVVTKPNTSGCYVATSDNKKNKGFRAIDKYGNHVYFSSIMEAFRYYHFSKKPFSSLVKHAGLTDIVFDDAK